MDKISIQDYLYIKNHWSRDCEVSNKDIFKVIYDNKNLKPNILIYGKHNHQSQIKYSMPNHFFNLILKGNNKWADIEQLYYDELLKVKDIELIVNKLNLDFETIKCTLQDYLNSLPKPPRISEIECILYSPIYFREVKQEKQQAYREEIKSIYETKVSSEIKKWLETSRHWHYSDNTSFSNTLIKNIENLTKKDEDIDGFLLPDNVYMLSFNYTNSEHLYKQSIKNNYKQSWIDPQINHIHGELNNPKNPIIFGYGDEYDNDYEQLEKSRVKGVLDNIKSMRYLETTNYRDFESFISPAPYQVIILGHSCALSDNTLLKTLFEHDNCGSIKPYYYEKVNEDEKWDNYQEIIQALSRCFSDKSKLRSVVVNKEWCSPLPQNKKDE